MNKLEMEIIHWLAKNNPDLEISSILNELNVVKREYTEIGFFVYFKSHAPLPNIKHIEEKGFSNILGPIIEASNLTEGAESLINTEHGVIKYIEVFSIGKGNASEISNFTLLSSNT